MKTNMIALTFTALLALAPQVRSEVATLVTGSIVADRYIGLSGGELSSDPVSQSFAKAVFENGTFAKVFTSRSMKGRWNDGSYGNEIDYGIGWSGKLSEKDALTVGATYWDEPSAGTFGKGDILYLKAAGTRSFKSFSAIATFEQFVPMRGSGFRGGSLLGLGSSVGRSFGKEKWSVRGSATGLYDTGVFGTNPAFLLRGSAGIDRKLGGQTTLNAVTADWWIPVSDRVARKASAMVYTGITWSWSK